MTRLSPSAVRRVRSVGLAGVLLAAAVLLGGCLKYALGDPERARVDPALAGVWFQRQDDNAIELWRVTPFDDRCYLAVQYRAKPDTAAGEGWASEGTTLFKAWLAEAGGKQFVSMRILSDDDSETPFLVARLDRAGETITLRGVDPDFVKKHNIDSPQAFAKLIQEHADNDALYLKPGTYEKAGDADAETVKAILRAFH